MIKLISKLKYIVRVISKKEILIWPQIKLDTTWFGNKHAGFYVNTKSLNSKSIILLVSNSKKSDLVTEARINKDLPLYYLLNQNLHFSFIFV